MSYLPRCSERILLNNDPFRLASLSRSSHRRMSHSQRHHIIYPIPRAVAYAYISPANLTNAFPFFGSVTDVASFDAGAFGYFSDAAEFQTTKFVKELGCSNATSAVIRWERTVLCSMWVNEVWSAQCLAFYSQSIRGGSWW